MIDIEVDKFARSIADQTLVWDNHACMPLRPRDESFLGQLQRAHSSGVDVISLNLGFGSQSLEQHLRMAASFRNWLNRRQDQYLLVKNIADIELARSSGRLAVFFDIEGMAPLDNGDYGLVALFRELGVGWMLIAYNRNNAAGGGCLDDDPGLSQHGREVLKEMKRVGMMVCCSHTGHRTARDVLDAADNPVIFSHSNAFAVYPHLRNIPDELIRACAATGGVVGVNGVGDFLGHGEDYVELLSSHIDHMVQLVGPEHVGIALDYVYDQQEVAEYIATMVETFGAEQAAEFSGRFAPPEVIPPLIARLKALGYSQSDLQLILGGNWYRVAKKVWI